MKWCWQHPGIIFSPCSRDPEILTSMSMLRLRTAQGHLGTVANIYNSAARSSSNFKTLWYRYHLRKETLLRSQKQWWMLPDIKKHVASIMTHIASACVEHSWPSYMSHQFGARTCEFQKHRPSRPFQVELNLVVHSPWHWHDHKKYWVFPEWERLFFPQRMTSIYSIS